jgi:hypothetical protein
MTQADAHLAALGVLDRCPLLWPIALGRLAGFGGPSASRAGVRTLEDAGLIAAAHLATAPGHRARLLYLTDAGRVAVGGVSGRSGAGRRREPPGRLRSLVPGLPHRLDCYELLCALALEHPGPPTLVDWRHPWTRQHPRPSGRSELSVRLPARAALAWPDARGAYLLLPDRGAFPHRAYRGKLAALVALQRDGVPVPPLLVATTDRWRADGWRRMIEEVARDAARPLVARVHTWSDLPSEDAPPAPTARRRRGAVPSASTGAAGVAIVGAPFGDARPPRSRADRLGCLALRLAPADRRLLDEVGPHPYVEVPNLAALTGAGEKGLRGRLHRLVRVGVVGLARRRLGPHGDPVALPELTRDGLAIAAAQHGLTPAQAVRYGGWVASPPDAPAGRRGAGRGDERAQLLGCLAHTLAVNRFMAGLARLARERPTAWGDALVAWRPAAVCARGRVRPDAYGIYRQAGRIYGFFLELDRSTEDAADYGEKFRAYYAYLETGAYELDYAAFPTVLVVTTSYAAERRIAAVLRALAVDRAPLPVLLTTEDLIARDPEGVLGPVWGEPGAGGADPGARRRRWLLGPTAGPEQEGGRR